MSNDEPDPWAIPPGQPTWSWDEPPAPPGGSVPPPPPGGPPPPPSTTPPATPAPTPAPAPAPTEVIPTFAPAAPGAGAPGPGGAPRPGGPAPAAGSGGPPPSTPGAPPTGGGGGWPWWAWALGVAGVAAVIGIVVLLLRDDDSGSVTEASTTTSETTTVETTVPETTTIPETTTTESTTTTSTTTTTVAPLTWPPGAQAVVAAADGIHLATDAGDSLAVAEQVSIALALPDGGFLVQDRSGRYAPDGGENNPATTAIRRTNGGVLLAPQAGQWLRLHDVNVVGGVGYALVTIDSGSTPDDMSEDLVLVALSDGAVTPVAPVGGWEAGTSRLSLGADGSIVGEYFAEATSGPLMLRTDGSPLIDPAALGLEGQYSDCATCPHLFTVSPDGRRIGWIENGALVVVDASNGSRQLDGPLPPDLAAGITGLEIGADELVLNRSDVATGAAQVGTIIAIIDGSATSFPIPVAGLVTLVS